MRWSDWVPTGPNVGMAATEHWAGGRVLRVSDPHETAGLQATLGPARSV